MDLGLSGKRALVLGGSSGLGRAVAAALVKEGARVAVASRDQARIEAAARELGAALGFTADLSQPEAGRRAVERASEGLGGVDILVCNTGGPPAGAFATLTDAQWREGFQSLWLSTVDAVQAALPRMREQKWGRVLLVTSAAAKEPIPGLTISNGLRAGLTGLAKSLCHEVAPDGVTVNCLLPGYTATERMKQLGVDEAKMAAQIPARRLGRPEEFAAAAVFLASVPAGYITGQALAIDGGYLRGN
jgi:3-oxoacyl-[acyl-carrier protein] reductase